jgi:hypothetical protein
MPQCIFHELGLFYIPDNSLILANYEIHKICPRTRLLDAHKLFCHILSKMCICIFCLPLIHGSTTILTLLIIFSREREMVDHLKIFLVTN